MATNSVRKAVLTTVRDMRAPREDALSEYVDALIKLNAAEDELTRARRRRDETRSHARDMGNTSAELDEAARIVRQATEEDGNGNHTDTDESATPPADGQEPQPQETGPDTQGQDEARQEGNAW